MKNEPVLTLKDISVCSHDRLTLSHFSYTLFPGEIHALVGEHGSGKTSFVRLLAGLIHRFQGELRINGRSYPSFTPKQSLQAGIGIVHQNIQLIPPFSALENIFMGRYQYSPRHIIRYRFMKQTLEAYLTDYNIDLDLKTPVESLSKQDRNKVALVRALFFSPTIAIFDEVYAEFNQDEMDLTYRCMNSLVERGGSVIYISSNMKEIFEFAHRVSIIRNGNIIKTESVAQMDKVKLIDLTYSFASTREELRQSNRELYNYKKYNEDIIKNLPVGVAILDDEHQPYLINKAIREALFWPEHYDPETIQELLACLDEELRQEITKAIDARIIMTWNEVCLRRDHYLKITLFPFRDDAYRFLGTILLIEDISRDYLFKNYLIQTERVSSIAELAAGVAHEINNPLSIILNYIELLAMKNKDHYAEEKLEKIRSEVNRIQGIIASLLSFSHPNDHPHEALDIVQAIEETLILLSHKFKQKKVEATFRKAESTIWIYGNENQLKQVFINLLVNSLEAVDSFGTIGISILENKHDRYVEIQIRDSGPGILPEIRNQIFNPFFTTKREKHNTGLGLSICQHIIEAHQGVIDCPAADATVFRIRLPMAQTNKKGRPDNKSEAAFFPRPDENQSAGEKSSFEAPQRGQTQSSGSFSKGVPGSTPLSGSPSAGS
jgi:two-component system sensor histidine kinase AtoS